SVAAEDSRSARCASIAARLARDQYNRFDPLPSLRSRAIALAMSTMIAASRASSGNLGRERLLRWGSAFERLGQRRKRILELARRHCLSSATETQVLGMLRRQGERIGDSGPTRRGG